jgi:hypothetical protein
MSGKRQKTEDPLALVPNGRGETLAVGSPRAEPLMAKPASESPALGSNAFRAQLRIPTGVLGPSGVISSATLRCRGLQHCG